MNHKVLKDKKICITKGKKIKLKNHNPDYNAIYTSKEMIKQTLEKYTEQISELQEKLYAQGKHSVLIILQAIDTAGKDSCIKHVMSGINPQGCRVTSFKQPSKEELKHDFLWRIYPHLPEKGQIAIFNRSYYEEVLVTKVHPEFILAQNYPKIKTVKDIQNKFWENRYDAINQMEKHLYKSGVCIIKLFLNISKKEQKKRQIERIDTPQKNWKFNPADITERQYWDKYQDAYEKMLQNTSTSYAPWHIIPSDNQWVSRAIVGDIILEYLQKLNPSFPKPTAEELAKMKECKKVLLAEK